jgi:predicted nucleotidyltransferase
MNTQTPVHIGNVVRNAVVFNFQNWVGEFKLTNPDSLLETVPRLFALLDSRQVNYVLVGGVALLTYVAGRNTQDIDLIMALPSLKKLPEIRIRHQEQDFVRGEFAGLQIDILLTRNPLFAEIQQRYAIKQQFVEREIPTATVEGLLLLKLYALPSLYRQGNFAKVGLFENDIAMLLHYYHPAVAPLLTKLTKYLGESDMAELRQIVEEIEQRIERFRKSAP